MPEIDYGPIANFIRPHTGADQKSADDVKRALLGDREAAKRLTDAGVLLPCPYCKGAAEVIDNKICADVSCNTYGCRGNSYFAGGDDGSDLYFDTVYEAILAWNTRAPILSAAEREMLEGME